MAYWTYILQSETTGRYYCGSTNNLTDRIARHNDPNYRGTQTTRRFPAPWKLIWSMEQTAKGDAIVLEIMI